MCGRFSQAYTWEQIVQFSQPLTDSLPAGAGNLRPRFNLAPTDTIQIIVRGANGGRELREARWGLVPAWWKKTARETGATFNARVERVAEAPMFRGAYKERRCIIPASGFFEWTGPKTDRTPHYFSAADGSLLAFAGLWEHWRDPEGNEVVSATIIVRDADAWTAKYHDRMPCMLHPRDWDAWLDGAAGKDVLMQPPPAMQEWIVSKRANKAGAGDDDPTTIDPVDPEA